MSSCIFACAKNEEPYIHEWLYYHLEIIHFDKIIIYDTSNDFSLSKTNINTDPRIDLYHKTFKGDFGPIQVANINDFISKYKYKYKWCAIIDIDEFIVLKDKNEYYINCFLEKTLQKGALGINWRFFGNNNHTKFENKPVINRFTRCENNPDKHIKSICVMKDINKYLDAHHASLSNGFQINEKGKKYNISPFQYDSSCDLIQLNHYIIKSTEEFNKRYIGHHTRSQAQLEDYYNCHNKNDVEDLTAFNKFNENNYHNNLNKIDYKFYIRYHTDLLINGIFNEKLAKEHYDNFGINEKRLCNLNFDFNFYKDKYSDLKHLNNLELWHHFKNDGLKENREFKLI